MVALVREQNQALKAFSVALRLSVLGEAAEMIAAEARVLIDRAEALRRDG